MNEPPIVYFYCISVALCKMQSTHFLSSKVDMDLTFDNPSCQQYSHTAYQIQSYTYIIYFLRYPISQVWL